MITLTSDFGLKDPYVAEMKGVILTINQKATIIDITHDIEKFNVQMAAFTLASAASYFPEGTVHLAVVDPEVGTKRRAIIIQTKKAYFIGPDNGILMLAAQSQGIKYVYQLTNTKFMLPTLSNTFHGRDVFAPAAAHLDSGVQTCEFGPEILDPLEPEFAQITRKGSSVIGEVVHVDGFGNIITNIGPQEFSSDSKIFKVEFEDDSLKLAFAKTYAQANSHEPVLVVGSHGFMEIALNLSNAAERFHAKAGDKVTITAS